ncbi:hypothetical protein [Anatilimnocola floriformis]|uniref:hypothetical protein n=1 Tax=Anatilimnocola floriformis TaxID=2948575 RepID=UPI0020C4B344|nr:hypothetical protein [Anatilimnocola floriformis]
MKSRFAIMLACAITSSLLGCSAKQPAFDPLHVVAGKVQRAGTPLAGGFLRFNPIPDKQEFIINSSVGADGAFKLTTVRTTDSKGERRPGAPAGEYSVVYTPDSPDQTAANPITLPQKVVIEAKENTLTLEVPAR